MVDDNFPNKFFIPNNPYNLNAKLFQKISPFMKACIVKNSKCD